MLYNLLRTASGFSAAVLVLLTAGLLGACGAPEGLDEEETARLEKRVAERWQSKIDRDFGTTWEYSTPEYRKNFPRDLYVQKFSYAVEWELTGVEVLNYDRSAAVASVAARVMSKPTKLTSEASRAIGAVPRTIREKWILVDGQWWYSANY
jgi:hypothetical protein